MVRPAVFLDRDGVIIDEVNYLARVEQVRGQRSSDPATVPRPVTWTLTRRSGRKSAPTVAVALTSRRQDGSRAPAQGPVQAENP